MAAPTLHWTSLPPLPDAEGFAGMFAGSSGGVLLVAGGANFPDQRPWEGGTKKWYDTIWALEKPDGIWKKAGKLPMPLGYGGSVTWRDEIICVGGSNADGHHAEVFSLRWDQGRLAIQSLPPLPSPCANFSSALVDGKVIVAGGIEKPASVKAMHTVWSFDPAHPDRGWAKLEPWPGKERMLSAAAGMNGALYLMSGAALHADREGKPEREWLKDAFRYTAQKGWEKLPDLPRVAVAAPTPALVFAGGICIVSGDDGSKFGFKPEVQHPGFPKDALLFDPSSGQWSNLGAVPFSRATVPTTEWRGGFVIPNGEARPGYRSHEVWWVKPE